MTIINNIDGAVFEINGAKYLKNFVSVIKGDRVKIVNIYDSRLELQCFKHFSEFTVNGNTFASAFDLQTALLPILFTRASLNGIIIESDIINVSYTRPILSFVLADNTTVNIDLNMVQTVSGTAVNNADPFNPIINLPEGSNLQVFSIFTDYEGLTFSEAVKSVQDARQIAAAAINQQPIFTVPDGFLTITKIAFQAETTQIIDDVPQVVTHTIEQQTILNTGAREYGVGAPPVTANDFSILTSTFGNPQTLIDLSSQFVTEAQLIEAGLEVIRNVFNNAPNCVIRSSAVVTATLGNTTRNWLFTGGEGMWGLDAKQALRDDMFYEINAGGGSSAVDSVNGQTGIVVLDTDDIADTTTNRYTNDADIARLANTSGTNTGDQILPTNTSDLVNDGEDGVDPFITTIPADAEWLANFPSGIVKFDKHYTVGTPASPMSGGLTLDLTGAKVGRVDTIYYTGTALPAFVTQWLQETDGNFVANEMCYIGLHLHKLDGANSVITGVVNNL